MWVTVDGRRRSTLDLFDGRLTLLTGRRGEAWRAAADRLRGGCRLTTFTLGRELHDDRGSLRAYGLDPEGAALVRPDGYLVWQSAVPDQPLTQLRAALDLALGHEQARGRLAA